MRKNKTETTEYIPEWDAGTYHTGAATPPKGNNVLVTVLLIAVICLGGMASVFGILNFRLLSQQIQHPHDTLNPLDTHASVVVTGQNTFFGDPDVPAPSVPEDRYLELEVSSFREEENVEEIYNRNERALVSVYCAGYGSTTLSGTGIVLSRQGYILTNAHILEGAQRIFVYLSDGQLLRASLVGSDSFTDLALLYVQAEGLTPALFALSESLQPQDTIHCLNNQPDADHNFLLSGTVYNMTRPSTGDLTVEVLQNSLWGHSGPIFDNQGRIVGIRAEKISRYFDDPTCQNQGLAVSCETILSVVAELAANGYMEGRPALGFQVATVSKLYQHYWQLPGGLMVTQLEENSNAAAQGIQDGDILLTLDGTQLTSRADLYAVIYRAQVGDQLTAAVFRDGRKFTVTLTVEEMQ